MLLSQTNSLHTTSRVGSSHIHTQIQLNGRFSVLMLPYSAVSHVMQIHCRSTSSTNIGLFLANTASTHIHLYVSVFIHILAQHLHRCWHTHTPNFIITNPVSDDGYNLSQTWVQRLDKANWFWINIYLYNLYIYRKLTQWEEKCWNPFWNCVWNKIVTALWPCP
jgi:hypothetical protein